MIKTFSALFGVMSGIGIHANDTPGGTPIRTVDEFLAMSASGVYYPATLDGKVCSVGADTVLYVLTLSDVTAHEIGMYSGNAAVK